MFKLRELVMGGCRCVYDWWSVDDTKINWLEVCVNNSVNRRSDVNVNAK